MVYNQSSINRWGHSPSSSPSFSPPPLLSFPQRHEFIIHPRLSKFNSTSPHSLCPPTGPCSYSPISSPLSSLCIPISPTYVKLLYYIIVIIFYRNSKSQITLESISKGCSWFMVESKGEWVSEWIPPLNNCHSAPIALIVVNRPVCSVVARRSSSVIRHRQTVCY